jgi:hypothetical protein
MAVSGAGIHWWTSKPHSRRRWRRRFGYGALVLLLAGGIFHAALRHHWHREFRQRVEAIRALGYPVTLAELDAWYQWPPGTENAAFRILEAAGHYHEPADTNDGWDLWFLVRDPPSARTSPLDDRRRALLEEHIAANAEPLKLLHEAATIKESRYPIDLKQDRDRGSPHHQDAVQACALLSVEAIHHVEHSNPADGVQSIVAALRVADSLASEPVLLTQANRVLCQALAIERYRLSHGRLPAGLDDLVPDYLPETPLDPFDGRPLRYRLREPGFTVYSIGPDQTDDGGRPRRPVRKGQGGDASRVEYDMTFIVER